MPKGCASCQHSAAVQIRLTRPGGSAGSVPARRGCGKAQPCLRGSGEVLLPVRPLRHRQVPRARFLLLLMGEAPAELSLHCLSHCSCAAWSPAPSCQPLVPAWLRGPVAPHRSPWARAALSQRQRAPGRAAGPGWALHGCSLASAAAGVCVSSTALGKESSVPDTVLSLQLVDVICFLGSASPNDSGF